MATRGPSFEKSRFSRKENDVRGEKGFKYRQAQYDAVLKRPAVKCG